MKNKTLKWYLSQKMRTEWLGGKKCSICFHHRYPEMARDIKETIRSKRRGAKVPWAVLFREYFVPEYKLNIKRVETLKEHIRHCMGLKA